MVAVRDGFAKVQVLRDRSSKIVWDGPLVVLTSRVSASASEIVAGALKDYDRAVVVGDVMLDRWFHGRVKRISPEAPVPVVNVEREDASVGGAANVAANLVGLGARCTVAGMVGNDEAQRTLQRLLEAGSIEMVLVPTERRTTTKTRVLGGNQQVVRLDFEATGPFGEAADATLLAACAEAMPQAELLILSDYGKGVCSANLCATLIKAAHRHGAPALVDPKTRDWSRYAGATLVTPNLRELCEVVGGEVADDDEAIERHARPLLDRFALGALLVTRSGRGMTLLGADTVHHVRSEAREVFDVTGAGDTVVATVGAGLAAGMTLADAADLANRAAGVVVGRAGTVPITLDSLRDAVLELPDAEGMPGQRTVLDAIARDRRAGHPIVFTNGCFDVLHRGHLEYLRRAKALGGRLVVAINSDASVRQLKGPGRPIVEEADRALMLSSLACVDYVCSFEEPTPAALIAAVAPDVLVKGGDYTLEQVVGREHAGRVVLVDFVEGYSSSAIIGRMKDSES